MKENIQNNPLLSVESQRDEYPTNQDLDKKLGDGAWLRKKGLLAAMCFLFHQSFGVNGIYPTSQEMYHRAEELFQETEIETLQKYYRLAKVWYEKKFETPDKK